MYVFSYYVQQLSLTHKGLRQFTLAPLVISCSASFTSPATQARYNDMFCDYRIKPNNHRTEISGYCTCITISSKYMYTTNKYVIDMLPTNLQPLARFKAVWPVSKPSLSTYAHVSAFFSLAYRLP